MTIVEYFEALAWWERGFYGAIFGALMVTHIILPYQFMKVLAKFEEQNARMVALLNSISESSLAIQSNTEANL